MTPRVEAARKAAFQALKEYVDRQFEEVDKKLAELRDHLAERRRVEKLWDLPPVNPPQTKDVN